jgi:uncharacterized protein
MTPCYGRARRNPAAARPVDSAVNTLFDFLFVEDAPAAVKTIENVIAGPIIAVLSFVCSIGNAPLAAVLWSGGISFAGVVAFIFADLIVLPIVIAYRKYYGWAFALRSRP